MAKIAHSTMRRGKDVSASTSNKEVHIVNDLSRDERGSNMVEDLDQKIAEFEWEKSCDQLISLFKEGHS